MATIRVNRKDGWPCQLRFFLDHLFFILALQLINIQIRFIYQCFSWKRCSEWNSENNEVLTNRQKHLALPPHPAALLPRLCLLAVCWLNMSKRINPISQGCWGEIGRSAVWLLPQSMHVATRGGWHENRLWPRYTVYVHGCCHLSLPSQLTIPKETTPLPPKPSNMEPALSNCECCLWSTFGAEQDDFTIGCTPKLQDGSQCSDTGRLLHALLGAQNNLHPHFHV